MTFRANNANFLGNYFSWPGPLRPMHGGSSVSMSYQIKLEIFEGPMDLLLYLIKKHELDIYSIPIALITQQYLEYLELMKSLDMEIAGDSRQADWRHRIAQ